MYFYLERNKPQARDRYLITGVEGVWCNIKKFTWTQLRRTSYRVRVSHCYKVEGFSTMPYDGELEINDDEE